MTTLFSFSLTFFLFICLWFLTGTGSEFLCFGGWLVVVVVVGWSSSVWPLWPPCQFSGTCLPRWYFSAWEQSTNTSCYNSPASACLSYFVLWADLEGRKKKHNYNMNLKYFHTLRFMNTMQKTETTYYKQTHLLLLKSCEHQPGKVVLRWWRKKQQPDLCISFFNAFYTHRKCTPVR